MITEHKIAHQIVRLNRERKKHRKLHTQQFRFFHISINFHHETNAFANRFAPLINLSILIRVCFFILQSCHKPALSKTCQNCLNIFRNIPHKCTHTHARYECVPFIPIRTHKHTRESKSKKNKHVFKLDH